MKDANGYLIAGLLIGIIFVSNLFALFVARRFSGTRMDWFTRMGEGVRRPFKHEDQSLDELSRLVGELHQEKEEKSTQE